MGEIRAEAGQALEALRAQLWPIWLVTSGSAQEITMPLEPLRPMAGERQPDRPIHPGAKIGHVHLKVADLDRALAFYCGVLGFELMQRSGTQAAFIAAGGYHHHIGLNTWESLG